MKNINYTQLAKDKLLEKGLKGFANHTSIPKMIGEICSELVKNNAVLPLVSISVCSRCGAKTVSHPSNLCYGCWMLSDS